MLIFALLLVLVLVFPIQSLNHFIKSMSGFSQLTMGILQLSVSSDKNANILIASQEIDKAANATAELLVLPECWNSPYSVNSFPIYAEEVPEIGQCPDAEKSPSTHMLRQKAMEHGIWIIGGSIPEREDDLLYNTCIIINNEGNIIGKHRKVHLFDIDVPGRIRFKESDALTAGQTPTLIQSPWGPIGIGICYDIRFPEYAILLRKLGARILVYPGAFNMVTGPAHWELLQRARAVDNQVFVATCSPARLPPQKPGDYVAWGHSTVINPWGEVIATTEENADCIIAKLDLGLIDSTRDSIPCWKQKRDDLYRLEGSDKM